MQDVTASVRLALAGSGNSNPQPSNRGVTDTSEVEGLGSAETLPASGGVVWAGVHWFAGTCKKPVSEVLEVVAGLREGVPVVEHARGARGGYSKSATVGGVFIAWGESRSDVFVSIKGEVCEELGIPGLAAMSVMLALEPSSRLDVAWDTDLLTPEMAENAVRAGDVVARFDRSPHPETGRMQGIERRSNCEGETVYLGSRKSERFVRFYDRRGPTRVEMELKERRAVELWRRLLALNDEEAWGMEALAELRHFVDFRKLDHGLNGKPIAARYRYLLPWWAAFVQGAERRSTVLPRKAAKLEDSQTWMVRYISTKFAMLYDVYGERIVRDMLTVGRAKYQARPDLLALMADALHAPNAAD